MELRKGYKKTAVGMIPEDWDVLLLQKITTDIGDGLHGTPIYSPNGSYFFINGNNLSNGKLIISEETKKVDHLEFVKHQRNLSSRTILMSINGTIGNLALFNGEQVILGKSAAYLNVCKNFCKTFMYYSFQTEFVKRQFYDGLTGSTIGNLGLKTIRNTKIPVPKLITEQRAIAEALSDVDTLIESLDRLIAKKRDIKQAAMQQLLTGKKRLPGFEGEWERKRLGDITEIIMGQSPSSSNFNLSGNGLPLIQGNADIEHRKTIRRIFTTQITKRGRCGDILMTVRAPVGEISRAMFDICLGRGVCAIRHENDFLYHYLIHLEPTWVRHSKGSTFDSVNSSDICSLEIHLPCDNNEQIAIATILSDMDTEIVALEKRRGKNRALKQAMIQELLTGRTRLI